MLANVLRLGYDGGTGIGKQVRSLLPRAAVGGPSLPPENFGPGIAAVALRGWRPREIKPQRSWRARVGAGMSSFFRGLALWRRRAVSRRLLLELDDRSLRDIGLDRAGAYREGSLPFWRAE